MPIIENISLWRIPLYPYSGEGNHEDCFVFYYLNSVVTEVKVYIVICPINTMPGDRLPLLYILGILHSDESSC